MYRYNLKYDMSRWHMLVVDDDEPNLHLHRDLLAWYRTNVYIAKSGKEALALVLSVPPLIAILLDLKMPDMDGWEVQKHLRALPELDGVPIIAVTASAMEGMREQVLDGGFDGYISKPFSPRPLIVDVFMWISQFREAHQ